MKEYIEREAAILALGDEPVVWDDYDMDGRAQSYAWSSHKLGIERVPAADVAPVVRCKECRHSSLPSGFTQRYGEPGTLSCHYGPCNRRNVKEDDFCSYGQRKEVDHA